MSHSVTWSTTELVFITAVILITSFVSGFCFCWYVNSWEKNVEFCGPCPEGSTWICHSKSHTYVCTNDGWQRGPGEKK